MEKFKNEQFERWKKGAEGHEIEKQGKSFWESNFDKIKIILESKESLDQKAEKIASLKFQHLLNLIQNRPRGEKFYSHITSDNAWFDIKKQGLMSEAFAERIKKNDFSKRWDLISKNDLIYLAADNETTWSSFPENPVFIIVDPDIKLCPPSFGELDTTARHRIAPRDILAVMITGSTLDSWRKEEEGKIDRKSNIWKYIENNRTQFGNVYDKPEYAAPIIAGEISYKKDPLVNFKFLLYPEHKKL